MSTMTEEKKTFKHPYLLEVAVEVAILSVLAAFIIINAAIA